MNGLDEDLPTPKVDYIRKSFFQTILGKIVIFGSILATILIVFLLEIFGFISILPKLQKQQLQNSTLKNLNLLCPVAGFDCGKTKPVKINDQPATGFELPKETKIVSPVTIVDRTQFIKPPYDKNSPIWISQSFIVNDQCYTITYTVPADANIANITTVPVRDGFQLIVLGTEYLNLDNVKDLNMVMQLQKRTIPPADLKKTDQQKCPVYAMRQEQFGTYETITPSILKNQ